jgi:putative SOS response-associated peptidase YedK
VAPTDSLAVVRYDRKAGQRSLDMLGWGLIPYWAKDIKVGFANINAKGPCCVIVMSDGRIRGGYPTAIA